MRTAWGITALLGTVCLILGFFVHVKMTFLGAAAFGTMRLGLLLMVIIGLFLGALRWRKTSNLWIGPSLISLALFFASPSIAKRTASVLNDYQFKRNLPSYERVIADVRNGTIPAGRELTKVDIKNITESAPDIIAIEAARCENGEVIAEFFRSGFRLRNGYLYKGYEEGSDCVRREFRPESRYQMRHVVGKWYQFSD